MRNITAQEMQEIVKKNPKAVVINVLSKKNYEEGHVPGSINIPEDAEDFAQQVQRKIKDKSTPLIVYCAGFKCSASTEAAKALEQNGFTNVLDFKGGMEEWRNAGNPVVEGAKA